MHPDPSPHATIWLTRVPLSLSLAGVSKRAHTLTRKIQRQTHTHTHTVYFQWGNCRDRESDCVSVHTHTHTPYERASQTHFQRKTNILAHAKYVHLLRCFSFETSASKKKKKEKKKWKYREERQRRRKYRKGRRGCGSKGVKLTSEKEAEGQDEAGAAGEEMRK